MSDLFARLGARALGVPGAVRPAIASLFLPRPSRAVPDEPDRHADERALGNGRAGRDDASAVMAPVSPGAPRGATAGPGLVPPRQTTESDRKEGVAAPETPSRRTRGGLTRVVEPPAPALHRDATPASDGAAARGTAAGPPSPAMIVPGPAFDAAGGASSTRSPENPGLTARPPERSRGGPAHVPAVLLLPAVRDAGIPARVEQDRPAGGPPPAAVEREVNEALGRLRRLGASPVTPRSPAGAPAPPERVVRISIGRIDVRAVPAPAPPPAASRPRETARPRLSLEDYLAKKGRART